MRISFPADATQGMETGSFCRDTCLTGVPEVNALQIAKLWIRGSLTALLVWKMLAGEAATNAPLTIVLYDRAHVGSKTLVQTERLATEIFAQAGVEAQWKTGSVFDGDALLYDFTAATREGCAQPLDSATVRVAILPRAPRGFSQQALGYALPCAARGIQVTIFADRVEIVSRTNLAAFYRVLGHAIAHEVGHVLLRSGVHDTTGLMRRVWAKSDWQRTAVTIIPFTSGQAECVRRELLRIEAFKRQPFRPLRFCENEATDLPWTPMVLDRALAISDWTCPAPTILAKRPCTESGLSEAIVHYLDRTGTKGISGCATAFGTGLGDRSSRHSAWTLERSHDKFDFH